MSYEFDLEVSGYTGRLIDDHVFRSIDDAEEYVKNEYGCDYDGPVELYRRDANSGVRELVGESSEPGTWWAKVYGGRPTTDA